MCDICKRWYHITCINLNLKSIDLDVEWYCKICEGSNYFDNLPIIQKQFKLSDNEIKMKVKKLLRNRLYIYALFTCFIRRRL